MRTVLVKTGRSVYTHLVREENMWWPLPESLCGVDTEWQRAVEPGRRGICPKCRKVEQAHAKDQAS